MIVGRRHTHRYGRLVGTDAGGPSTRGPLALRRRLSWLHGHDEIRPLLDAVAAKGRMTGFHPVPVHVGDRPGVLEIVPQQLRPFMGGVGHIELVGLDAGDDAAIFRFGPGDRHVEPVFAPLPAQGTELEADFSPPRSGRTRRKK